MQKVKSNILILAQIPPPFHGQSIMQKHLVDSKWDWCNKSHINLDFSDHVDEVGKFHFKKPLRLLKIIMKIILERLKHKINVCYYPPSLTNRLPFYRDLIIVLILKIFCEKFVFHFHAGGASRFYNKLTFLEMVFAKTILRNIDLAISLLPSLQEEADFLNPKRHLIIPNGIKDEFNLTYIKEKKEDEIDILFLGNLHESKGIFDLADAARLLIKKGYSPNIVYVGSWESPNIEAKFLGHLQKHSLITSIKILGTKTYDDKYSIIKNSDIFCFPTFYPIENQPLVLLEAMMFGLPIVTTRWRAIPDFITDGEEGFLVPINSPQSLADKLELLITNREMRIEMGKKGRDKYLKLFTLQTHLEELEKAFKKISLDE